MKKMLVMVLLLCGIIFTGVVMAETEPNNDESTADALVLGGDAGGGFNDAEDTWLDIFVFTVDKFGVVYVEVNPMEGLSVAPGVWREGANYMLPASIWTDYGERVSDTEYLFPGTYYLHIPGSKDYSAGHSLTYSVITSFQSSPPVLEVEPNNDHASASNYALGEEMTGVWSEEDFNTGGQTSHDFFNVYLIPGAYEASAEYDEAVCFGIELQRTDGTRVLQVDEDTQPRMWYWMEGEGSKSAEYEITEEGNYFIYAETEGCHFKTTDADEFNYLLVPYTFTFSRVGDLGETPPAVDDEIPEPTLYDEEFPEPTLYDDDGAPPAPPECESNSDCPSGACINGYCYVEPKCPYECCTDLDCPELTEICENNECIDVLAVNCGEKTCGEDEFLNSACECTPLGGGIDPCCGTAFALLAVFGFAASRKK